MWQIGIACILIKLLLYTDLNLVMLARNQADKLGGREDMLAADLYIDIASSQIATNSSDLSQVGESDHFY